MPGEKKDKGKLPEGYITNGSIDFDGSERWDADARADV